MQALFGSGAGRHEERGPFPFAELLLLLAFFAALGYWFTLHGSPPATAILICGTVYLLLVVCFLIAWRSGGFWEARVKPGPFPWPAFRKENVLGVTLMAFFAIGRLPVSLIEIVAGFLLAWDGLWVGKWLRANSPERSRKPDG